MIIYLTVFRFVIFVIVPCFAEPERCAMCRCTSCDIVRCHVSDNQFTLCNWCYKGIVMVGENVTKDISYRIWLARRVGIVEDLKDTLAKYCRDIFVRDAYNLREY